TIKIKELVTDISARSTPLKSTMAERVRDWKSGISTILGLPEDTAQSPLRTKGLQRGLYIGLASALIFGALILPLLQRDSAPHVFGFVFFGSIAILALLGLTVVLIMDLLD